MTDRFSRGEDTSVRDPLMERIERSTRSAHIARMWKRAAATVCVIGAATFAAYVLYSNNQDYQKDVLTAPQKEALEDKVLDAMSRGCGVDMLMRGSQEPVYYPAANVQKYFDSEIVPNIKDGTYTGIGNVYPENDTKLGNTFSARSGSVYERTSAGVSFKGTQHAPKRNTLG